MVRVTVINRGQKPPYIPSLTPSSMPPSLKRSVSESPENEQEHDNERARKARKVDDDREDPSDYEDIEVNLDNSDNELESPLGTQSSEKAGVAQAGTVGRVEVVNFMCHTYLRIDFGPKINFVIGHNGSGKSAILTAITVALGAKASSTNRGKKLSSLIREGANAALVAVHITNKGPDAYRHDVYGDAIVVERKILQDGVGNYRIKSLSGKTISTKREELTAILDHHSIQVDNPLTILSQDNAREFLNSSSPTEKYKLFMRGTQLAQLMEDYTIVRESLDTTDAIVARKRQCIPELQKRAREAHECYQQAQKLDKLEEEIEELGCELSWSQVTAKEKEVASAKSDLASAEKLVDEAQQDVVVKQNKVEHLNQKITKINENIEACRTRYAPSDQEKALVEKNKIEVKTKLNELKTDTHEINVRVKQAKARKHKHSQEIAKKESEQAVRTQSAREHLQVKIAELNKEKAEKETEVNQYKSEIETLEEQKKVKEAERVNINKQGDRIQQNMRVIHKRIEELRGQKSNRLRAFGKSVPEVLGDIDAERQWKRKPVGPLGRYVKLKYAEYTETMELVLGKLLNAFVVENYDDRRLLMSILERRRMGDTIVLVSRYDLFDYKKGEPDDQYLTMLRALDIEDEWVKRQLIIARGIEKTLLMADREEANRVMEDGGPRNVKACFTSSAQKIGARRGMRVESLEKYRGPPRFKKDIDPEINEAEDELRQQTTECDTLKRQKIKIEEELNVIRRNIQQLVHKKSVLDDRIREVSFDIRGAQDQIQEEEPVTINMLRDEVKRQEDLVTNLILQFQDLKRQDDELRIKLGSLDEKLQQLESDVSQRIIQQDELRSEVRSEEQLKQRAMASYANVKEHHKKQVVRRNQLIEKVKELEATVKHWTEAVVQEWPVRVETNRSPAVIKREIDKLEIVQKQRNEALGRSVEQAQREAADALRVYDDAKRTIRMMDGLRSIMHKALDSRIDRWNEFRMFIALAAKAHFTYYMHKRGDNGYLKFSHSKEKLHIRVSTADQFKRGTRHKDSKSLSGGEKSFSQISLLLSMWQGIASPIVCLDEFDVYMDAVNRQQSMRMMMESAYEQSESQYILITPQDASNMTPGPLVTVHRLNDPKRQDVNNE